MYETSEALSEAVARAVRERSEQEREMRRLIVSARHLPALAFEANRHKLLTVGPSGAIGTFGAAVAAAAALGLDADGLYSAIGIVRSMDSGSMEFLAGGCRTRRLHPALAMRSRPWCGAGPGRGGAPWFYSGSIGGGLLVSRILG